jgi:hypothetical protein
VIVIVPVALTRLRWTALAATAAGAAGIALASGAVRLPCPFRAAFGVDCPMCGGSRMLGALMHGDVVAAADLNAFGLFVIVPMAVVLLITAAWTELGRTARLWPDGRRGVVLAIAFGAVLVAWTVLRNLPVDPFLVLRA